MIIKIKTLNFDLYWLHNKKYIYITRAITLLVSLDKILYSLEALPEKTKLNINMFCV